MTSILKKCLSRTVLFLAYGLLGGWVFMIVERREESNANTSDRLMQQLRKGIAAKYNFSDKDFDAFVKQAYEAGCLRSKDDWTYFNSTGFTFAAITTVGKYVIGLVKMGYKYACFCPRCVHIVTEDI